ncbi:MAG TPA: hypothetical protein VEY71_00485 [Chitinophagales bacterium]|nr:hypothetical protein [Chitinophagales bacterium]
MPRGFAFVSACALACLLTAVSSCRKDLAPASMTGFPEKVNTVMQTRCAVSGCHNDRSKDAAGGLSLDTWGDMMRGGRNGAVVIPFRSNRSLIHLYTNTFEDIGVSLKPTMPVNEEPLNRDEVMLLKNWINQGAPNANGLVAFSQNPNRQKFYVSNQGCDEIAVVDAESKLIMRYIGAGSDPQIEAPHYLRTSPDGKYLFSVFATGSVVQKFDCATDQLIGSVNVTQGSWNTIALNGDGTRGVISDFQSDGRLVLLDLLNMAVIKSYSGLVNPHGLWVSDDFKLVYCTSQYGNFIYKIDITDVENPELEQIVLQPGAIASSVPSLDPHEILFSPDGSLYFVTCQRSNEVRVMDATADTLVQVLATGVTPLEMAMSHTNPYLFVACSEEPSTNPRELGAVDVFNYETLQYIKTIKGNMYQPHGIAVNDAYRLVAVSNRNLDSNGPAPHHTTDCGGRNGFLQLIDLNTLELVKGYRAELSGDPYSVTSRYPN